MLTLCLPGLLLPPQVLLDTAGDLPLPALARLLGSGRLRLEQSASHYDWLARAVGLAALPAAALRLLGEGGDPGTADWLCLDPVHLKVHRSGIALDDPAALALDADDDAELRAVVAAMFTGIGELSAGAVGHWHLRLRQPAALATLPLPDAVGRDIDPRQPAGADAAVWRGLLAEAQTTLHAHPVNRRREAAGKPAVNSLWPWGDGRLPARAAARWPTLATRDPVLAGLARHLGAGLAAPPERYADATAGLIVIDALAAPARTLDGLAWRDALEGLERDWFAPLAAALRSGRLSDLRIAGFGGDGGFEVELTRLDLWKFWRRPRPLTAVAP